MVLYRGGARAFCTIAQRRHVARRVEDVFCGGSGKAPLSNAGRLGALYWASGGQGWQLKRYLRDTRPAPWAAMAGLHGAGASATGHSELALADA